MGYTSDLSYKLREYRPKLRKNCTRREKSANENDTAIRHKNKYTLPHQHWFWSEIMNIFGTLWSIIENFKITRRHDFWGSLSGISVTTKSQLTARHDLPANILSETTHGTGITSSSTAGKHMGDLLHTEVPLIIQFRFFPTTNVWFLIPRSVQVEWHDNEMDGCIWTSRTHVRRRNVNRSCVGSTTDSWAL